MSRPRIHATPAARQKAFRGRQRRAEPPPPVKPSRRPSRLKRVAAIIDALQELAAEYQAWRDALPANLADTELASKLEDASAELADLADTLGAIDLPQGFGR